MPDCNYCDESFADEDAYIKHLDTAHDEGELSRIDRRRVESRHGDDDGETPTGPLILGGLLVFSLAVLAYATFVVWGGGGSAQGFEQTPTNVGSVHEHGTINVTIDGQELDFSKREFQKAGEYEAFHFENGNGEVWHKHAEGVTIEWAMASIGIGLNETSVHYDGLTYHDSDPGTNVTIEVNNESVDPLTYELQGVKSDSGKGGDHIKIVVTTDNGG